MNKDQRDELTIREVTRENWRATLRLAVHPDQQRFIADGVPIAAIALAKVYIRPRGWFWLPYAFYAATEMIDFTELVQLHPFCPGTAHMIQVGSLLSCR